MSSKFEVKIDGLEELDQELKRLAQQVGDDETEDIVFHEAERLAEKIRERAPVGPTGNLKDAVVAKLMPRSPNFPSVAIAAIDRRKAPHAHLVEFGTGPRYHESTGKYVGEMPPNPFFRQTVNTELPKAKENIRNELKRRVEQR